MDPSLPMAYHNVLINSERPRGTLASFAPCPIFLARRDLKGKPFNLAQKSWQCVSDFLYQFGRGGLVFSGMDGLGAVVEACIHMGGYDVVACEKDPRIWEEAKQNIAEFIKQTEDLVLMCIRTSNSFL